MDLLHHTINVTLSTLRDVLPIVLIIFGFQWLVIRRPIHNPKRVFTGLVYVVIGLALFLVGLQEALFPLGELMARQLTRSEDHTSELQSH